MKENKYDNPKFFKQYSQMTRSVDGLEGAGEWHVLKKMLPNFEQKRVLDLGCGFGWHCQWALEHGARSVVGIDISEKMIERARKIDTSTSIEYNCMAIEDYDFPADSFDVVISSLAFHYLESFDAVCKKVNQCLTQGGVFVFSAEHPVFTAYGNQSWHCDADGNALHWPVDRYFEQGKRHANFLGEDVVKYHKTLTTYINDLLQNGFEITEFREPEPDQRFFETFPQIREELRRPMFIIISARKK